MRIIAIIAAIIVAVIFTIFWIVMFVDWCDFNSGGVVKFRLKIFKQIFLVNPDRWKYESTWYQVFNHLYYTKKSGNRIQVKLSFPAYLWFFSYVATEEGKKERQKEHDCLVDILETCQADIDRIKQKSERQIEQALKDQKRILENWR